jgi:ribonuclease HII
MSDMKSEGRRKKSEVRGKKEEVEIFTLFPSFHLPLSPSGSNTLVIAGVDEVGRGALFGPVVAAACILPDEVLDELASCGVRDSKQLSAQPGLG